MTSPIERVLRNDRLVLSVLLAGVTTVAWAAMARMGHEGPGNGQKLMPCCATFGLIFWMWFVMMAGMMIPSVTPMVLTHAVVMRRRSKRDAPFVSSGLFLSGYLAAWSGFSLVAALAQWALHRSSLLDPETLRIHPL